MSDIIRGRLLSSLATTRGLVKLAEALDELSDDELALLMCLFAEEGKSEEFPYDRLADSLVVTAGLLKAAGFRSALASIGKGARFLAEKAIAPFAYIARAIRRARTKGLQQLDVVSGRKLFPAERTVVLPIDRQLSSDVSSKGLHQILDGMVGPDFRPNSVQRIIQLSDNKLPLTKKPREVFRQQASDATSAAAGAAKSEAGGADQANTAWTEEFWKAVKRHKIPIATGAAGLGVGTLLGTMLSD